MLLDSRYPIVVIETWEELRALDLIHVSMKEGRPVFAWNAVDGLRSWSLMMCPARSTPLSRMPCLARSRCQPARFYACVISIRSDGEPKNVRLIEIALHHERLQLRWC